MTTPTSLGETILILAQTVGSYLLTLAIYLQKILALLYGLSKMAMVWTLEEEQIRGFMTLIPLSGE